MNTPQVETVEISDAELDNVSGGLSSATLDTATAALNGVAPVDATVATVVSTVEGASGLSVAPVQGLVAGL